MQDYLFFLGRDRDLSKLELFCYFDTNNIKYNLKRELDEALLINIEELDFSKIITELAGIIKIAKVIDLKSFNPSDFVKGNKINYGVSFYSKKHVDILDFIKNNFKEDKIKAFLKKPRREDYFMPSEVIKHKFLEDGFELIIFKDYIAYTIAVFNPKHYIRRDETRPYFDNKRVISIRLANILINISKVKPGQTLLDPFCGVGTILQEALLKNVNVIGVDIDKKTIEGCNNNLKWLKSNYNNKNPWKLYNIDNNNLSNYIKKVDVVVTEPYLGPFLKKDLNSDQTNRIVDNLESLYFKLFKELTKITSKIIFITPVFITKGNKKIELNFNKIILNTGFKILDEYNLGIPINYKYISNKFDRKIWVLSKKLSK